MASDRESDLNGRLRRT